VCAHSLGSTPRSTSSARHSVVLTLSHIQPFTPALRLLMARGIAAWLGNASVAKPAREIFARLLGSLAQAARDCRGAAAPHKDDLEAMRVLLVSKVCVCVCVCVCLVGVRFVCKQDNTGCACVALHP